MENFKKTVHNIVIEGANLALYSVDETYQYGDKPEAQTELVTTNRFINDCEKQIFYKDKYYTTTPIGQESQPYNEPPVGQLVEPYSKNTFFSGLAMLASEKKFNDYTALEVNNAIRILENFASKTYLTSNQIETTQKLIDKLSELLFDNTLKHTEVTTEYKFKTDYL